MPILARQAAVLAADADLLDAVSDLVDPESAGALSDAPDAVGRRSIRNWLTGRDGHPPSLAAVERVLDVARQQRRATELPGGRRVTRARGRLSVEAEPADSRPRHRSAPVQSRRDHR